MLYRILRLEVLELPFSDVAMENITAVICLPFTFTTAYMYNILHFFLVPQLSFLWTFNFIVKEPYDILIIDRRLHVFVLAETGTETE